VAGLPIEDNKIVAHPYRNNTLQKTFSPNSEAAGPFDRRVLGRPVGPIDETTEQGGPTG
jgi:hypothetical protein